MTVKMAPKMPSKYMEYVEKGSNFSKNAHSHNAVIEIEIQHAGDM